MAAQNGSKQEKMFEMCNMKISQCAHNETKNTMAILGLVHIKAHEHDFIALRGHTNAIH